MQFASIEDVETKVGMVMTLTVGNFTIPQGSFAEDRSEGSSHADMYFSREDANSASMDDSSQKKASQLDSKAIASGTATTKASMKSDSSVDEDNKDLVITRKAVTPLSEEELQADYKGPLSSVLDEDDVDFSEMQEGAQIVKVYLPNLYLVQVVVSPGATVQDVINLIIRKANALARKEERKMREEDEAKGVVHDDAEKSGNYYYQRFHNRRDLPMPLNPDPLAYELRLEQGDGECDMDFPSLERSRSLLNFCDGGNMFCLVTVSDYHPRPTTPMESGVISMRFVYKDKEYVESGQSNMTVRQLFNRITHHLPPGLVYELAVFPEDKERLKMVSDVMSMNSLICDVDVHTVKIRIKRYQDAPKFSVAPKVDIVGQDNVAGPKNVEDTAIVLSNFEAGKYTEWNIMKITTNAKLKARLLTIDRDEIQVRRVDSFCAMGPRVRSIFISDVVSCTLEQTVEKRIVTLTYYTVDMNRAEDQSRDVRVKYNFVFEAKTAEDAYEIVTRVDHLIRTAAY